MPFTRYPLSSCLLLAAGLSLGAFYLGDPLRLPAQPDLKTSGPSDAELGRTLDIAGSPSCSALSCHGSITIRESPTSNHNEFTIWARTDPHTGAYAALTNERSKKMGALLKITPHEDPLCLACHTNPVAALLPKDEKKRRLLEAERHWGTGCESCHGAAQDWLVEHTRPEWRGFTTRQKADLGMVPFDNLAVQFRNCAGCHVGAPAGNGLPIRDVTHDFIAAGHPRLQFEPSTFLANLPPHWRPDRKTRTSRSEGHTWALGQLAAAAASVDLTLARSERPDSWPELAEFSCYACHHDLEADSWRQLRDLNAKERGPGRLGAVPLSEWYWTGPELLAETKLFASPDLKPSLEKLNALLSLPSRAAPADWKPHALAAKGSLDQMLRQAEQPWATDQSKAFLAQIGNSNFFGISRSWDQAEQLFLGCLALNQDARLKELDILLRGALEGVRVFPPDLESPLGFRPEAFFPKLEKALRSAD